MSTNQDILNLLEDYQVQDDFLAEKYESISTQKRALIKTAIAFQFSFHKAKCEEEQYFSNKNSSFFYGIHTKPIPFLLCVLEDGFASPAKLLSVLCPAVIAGAENIYIFLAPNMSDSILASLELSGMENIFILDENSPNKSSVNENSNDENSNDENFVKKNSSDNNFVKESSNDENLLDNNPNTINKNISLVNSCLKHLSNDSSHEKGRVVLFSKDNKKNTLFTQIEESTQKLAIPSYIDNYNPSVYAKKENHDLVRFAYTCPLIKEDSTKEDKAKEYSTKEDKAKVDSTKANSTKNTKEHQSLEADCPNQATNVCDLSNNNFTTLRQNASANFTETNQTITDISFIPHLSGIQNYGDAMELCYIHPAINIEFFINKKISAQLCCTES